jgi:hypothetical protein
MKVVTHLIFLLEENMELPDLSLFWSSPVLMAFVAALLARVIGRIAQTWTGPFATEYLAVVIAVFFFVIGRVLGEQGRALVVDFLYVLLAVLVHSGLLPYEETAARAFRSVKASLWGAEKE